MTSTVKSPSESKPAAAPVPAAARASALPTPIEWTARKPSAPGFYLHVPHLDANMATEVRVLCLHEEFLREGYLAQWGPGWFLGPLPVPPLPQGRPQ